MHMLLQLAAEMSVHQSALAVLAAAVPRDGRDCRDAADRDGGNHAAIGCCLPERTVTPYIYLLGVRLMPM